MEVGVRELRNETSRVIEAVRAGERVTLTVRGEPIAEIVPHGARFAVAGGSGAAGVMTAWARLVIARRRARVHRTVGSPTR
jgi:prevent-host-death family protein